MEFENLYIADGVQAGVIADSSDKSAAGIVLPEQTHGCEVAVIGRDGVVPSLASTDAVVSLCPGIRIGVRTADCVPVLIYAPDVEAVAAVHAGWKGSLSGIVTETVRVLEGLGANPALMHAAFGPSICGKCYEVAAQMTFDFRKAGFAAAVVNERHISLEMVNRIRLREAGVPAANITGSRRCTFETTELPSWRRDRTSHRLVTWIGL